MSYFDYLFQFDIPATAKLARQPDDTLGAFDPKLTNKDGVTWFHLPKFDGDGSLKVGKPFYKTKENFLEWGYQKSEKPVNDFDQ